MFVAKTASLEEVTLELTHFSSLIPFMRASALLLWPSTFAQSYCQPGPLLKILIAARLNAVLHPRLSAAVGALHWALPGALRMRAARASPVSPVTVTPAPPAIRLDFKECLSECREAMAHSAESEEYLDCAQVVVAPTQETHRRWNEVYRSEVAPTASVHACRASTNCDETFVQRGLWDVR